MGIILYGQATVEQNIPGYVIKYSNKHGHSALFSSNYGFTTYMMFVFLTIYFDISFLIL